MSYTMIGRAEGFKGSKRERKRGGPGRIEREHHIVGVASIKAGQEEALLMRTWATPSPMYTFIKLQHIHSSNLSIMANTEWWGHVTIQDMHYSDCHQCTSTSHTRAGHCARSDN